MFRCSSRNHPRYVVRRMSAWAQKIRVDNNLLCSRCNTGIKGLLNAWLSELHVSMENDPEIRLFSKHRRQLRKHIIGFSPSAPMINDEQGSLCHD